MSSITDAIHPSLAANSFRSQAHFADVSSFSDALSFPDPVQTHFTLHAASLPSATCGALCDFLAYRNTHLLSLDLSNVTLTDLNTEAILSAIALRATSKNGSPLRSLSLQNVGLSEVGALHLAAVLAKGEFGDLESLDLSNNAANWPGIHALERACKARNGARLSTLCLHVSGNLIVVECLNATTHGIGAAVALLGGIALTLRAIHAGLAGLQLASLVVFVASLFTLLTSSCVYHSAFRHPVASRCLRKADHCSIFVLIAGSYTPFVVCYTLDPPTVAGPLTLTAVWTCAAIGVARSMASSESNRARALFALATGWLGAFSVRTMMERMEQGALWGVVAGGLTYSVGMVFYLLGKRLPMMHVVWHIAVMVGGAFHYYVLWKYVAKG